jgi:diaminopimelate epimerase
MKEKRSWTEMTELEVVEEFEENMLEMESELYELKYPHFVGSLDDKEKEDFRGIEYLFQNLTTTQTKTNSYKGEKN